MRILAVFVVLVVTFFLLPPNDQDEKSYYFMFEETEGKMRYYFNKEKQKKSYTYYPDRAASIYFVVKKENEEFIEKTISPKDTIGLDVKTYAWLNRFDNLSRDRYFNHKPQKKYFIIEKDSISDMLRLMEVNFIDEIE